MLLFLSQYTVTSDVEDSCFSQVAFAFVFIIVIETSLEYCYYQLLFKKNEGHNCEHLVLTHTSAFPTSDSAVKVAFWEMGKQFLFTGGKRLGELKINMFQKLPRDSVKLCFTHTL